MNSETMEKKFCQIGKKTEKTLLSQLGCEMMKKTIHNSKKKTRKNCGHNDKKNFTDSVFFLKR